MIRHSALSTQHSALIALVICLLFAGSPSASPVTNFARVTVSTGYDAAATIIVLGTGHGAKLPATSGGVTYPLVWWNSTLYPDPTDDPNVEIVLVTDRSGDTLTVTRGFDGTTATAKNTPASTYKMILAVTRTLWEQANPADVVGIGNYPDFATAVTKIGSAVKTLRISSPTTVSASITIPKTLTVEFIPPGQLVCSTAGVTIAFHGSILAENTKIMNLSGGCLPSFPNGGIIIPHWLGINADGLISDTASINTTIMSLATAGSMVFFPCGTYLIETVTALNSKQKVSLRGSGPCSTIKTTSNAHMFDVNSASQIEISGFRFLGTYTGTDVLNQQAIVSNPGASEVHIHHNHFENLGGALFLADGASKWEMDHNTYKQVNAPIQGGTGACKKIINIHDEVFDGVAGVKQDDAIAMSGCTEDLNIGPVHIDCQGSTSETVMKACEILLESSSSGLASKRAKIHDVTVRNLLSTHALQSGTGCIKIVAGGDGLPWEDVKVTGGNELDGCYRGLRIDGGAHVNVKFGGKTIIRRTTDACFRSDGVGVIDLDVEGIQCHSPGSHGVAITNATRPRVARSTVLSATGQAYLIDNSPDPILEDLRGISATQDCLEISNSARPLLDLISCTNNGRYGINFTGTVTTPRIGRTILHTNATANLNGYTVPDFPNNDTTPTVLNGDEWRANNSSATTITAFDDGIEGQEFTMFCANGNTTVQNGGSVILAGAVNFVCTSNDTLRLKRISGSWVETGRSVN